MENPSSSAASGRDFLALANDVQLRKRGVFFGLASVHGHETRGKYSSAQFMHRGSRLRSFIHSLISTITSQSSELLRIPIWPARQQDAQTQQTDSSETRLRQY